MSGLRVRGFPLSVSSERKDFWADNKNFSILYLSLLLCFCLSFSQFHSFIIFHSISLSFCACLSFSQFHSLILFHSFYFFPLIYPILSFSSLSHTFSFSIRSFGLSDKSACASQSKRKRKWIVLQQNFLLFFEVILLISHIMHKNNNATF